MKMMNNDKTKINLVRNPGPLFAALFIIIISSLLYYEEENPAEAYFSLFVAIFLGVFTPSIYKRHVKNPFVYMSESELQIPAFFFSNSIRSYPISSLSFLKTNNCIELWINEPGIQAAFKLDVNMSELEKLKSNKIRQYKSFSEEPELLSYTPKKLFNERKDFVKAYINSSPLLKFLGLIFFLIIISLVIYFFLFKSTFFKAAIPLFVSLSFGALISILIFSIYLNFVAEREWERTVWFYEDRIIITKEGKTVMFIKDFDVMSWFKNRNRLTLNYFFHGRKFLHLVYPSSIPNELLDLVKASFSVRQFFKRGF